MNKVEGKPKESEREWASGETVICLHTKMKTKKQKKTDKPGLVVSGSLSPAAAATTTTTKKSMAVAAPVKVEAADRVACFEWHVEMRDAQNIASLVYTTASSSMSSVQSAKLSPRLTVLHIDPYRGQSYNRERNDRLGTFLATHGYNYVATDVRGTGQSTGVATDEYSLEEMKDTLQLLQIIPQQNWSRGGKVIMYGLSYSAFTALQAALNEMLESALKEPILVGAFVMHGSHDRFKVDIHWSGGVKTVTDWLGYATAMTPFNMLPRRRASELHFPDEDGQEEGEEEEGEIGANEDVVTSKREAGQPWILNWVDKDNASYWKSGSLGESARNINIPVFLYGGFHDLYAPSMFALHKLLPNNVTVITQQGHEYAFEHDAMLLWWLTKYKETKGQSIHCLAQTSHLVRPRWIHGLAMTPATTTTTTTNPIHHASPQSTWNIALNTSGVVPLDWVCGPLYRSCAESVCNPKSTLKQELEQRGLKFPLPTPTTIDPARYLMDIPTIDIWVEDAPDDFYLVAWLLDDAGYLYSMGAQRWIRTTTTTTTTTTTAASVYRMELAPVCIALRAVGSLTLYLTTSNLPNLIPQFWLTAPIRVRGCCFRCVEGGTELSSSQPHLQLPPPLRHPSIPFDVYEDEPISCLEFSPTVPRLFRMQYDMQDEERFGEREDETLSMTIDDNQLTATFTNRCRLIRHQPLNINIGTTTSGQPNLELITTTTLLAAGRQGMLRVQTTKRTWSSSEENKKVEQSTTTTGSARKQRFSPATQHFHRTLYDKIMKH